MVIRAGYYPIKNEPFEDNQFSKKSFEVKVFYFNCISNCKVCYTDGEFNDQSCETDVIGNVLGAGGEQIKERR